MAVLYLVLGFGLLYFGAEGLVRGSSNIAIRMGIKPIIVGLTVVAFGTSSPELFVSTTAAFNKTDAIAIGNIIGSNICNIALILGVASIIRPINIQKTTLRKDVLVMIGITSLLVLFAFVGGSNEINFIEGLIFFSLFWGYIYMTFREVKKHKKKQKEIEADLDIPPKQKNIWISILFMIGGIVGLVYGSDFFVLGAKEIALYLGLSNAVIGLTLVAFGTSLPELATTIVAATGKANDIAFGNAIGSNIFNVLLVLGLTSIIIPISTLGISSFDWIILIAISVLLYPLCAIGMKLTRANGVFLLLIYSAYMAVKAFNIM
jgi:cation:H+ antiporter